MTTETTREITEMKSRYEEGDIIDCSKLDDLVHSLASASASALNNKGSSIQIDYIVEQLGKDEALATLERLIGAS